MGMPLASCSHLRPEQLAAAAELAAEFLGQSGADALQADFAAFPELAIALTIDGAVAGVAFGRPRREDGATLEGITVDDAHTARGLGSLLLARPSTWSSSRTETGSASTWTASTCCANGTRIRMTSC
jgi:GNAT superfamily N-acetyltransferase